LPESQDMQYRPLGRTGINVSVAGLGTGGLSRMGQATHQDRDASKRLVGRALDLGINLFDTAPAYGDAETILGEALRGVPREGYFLTTKVRWSDAAGILSETKVIESCEQSLQRLGIDYVDVLQFHGLLLPIYREAVDQLYPAAEKLRQQGKIRFIGITERPDTMTSRSGETAADAAKRAQDPYGEGDLRHDMLIEALKSDVWDTIMVRHGILNFTAEDSVYPMALKTQTGVLSMASIRVRLATQAALEEVVRSAKAGGLIANDELGDSDPLGFLVHDHVDSTIAAAYKFSAAPAAVSTVLIGTGSVAHLEADISHILGPSLPVEDEAKLRRIFAGVAISG